MTGSIGRKYEEKRVILMDLIREGNPNVLETKAENNSCYLCRKRIKGKMFVLTLNEKNSFSKFYIDEGCYRRAKLFTEYNGIPFSLN